MRAEILTIGTELLIGQVVNTNATYLAQELARLGIDLYYVTTVGDNPERLLQALKLAWERSDLVLCSGGLGPTADDLTHETIATFLGEPMVVDETILAHVERLFSERNRALLPEERKLATFPRGVELIRNPAGTASGIHVSREGKHLMTFPGVPHELGQMWETWARPVLEGWSGGTIRSRLLKFAGINEADAAHRVADLLEGNNPSVAPYAGNGEVHLRVTAKADSPEQAEAMLDPVVRTILDRLGEWYFGADDETLPSAVGALLRARGEKLAVAESCTSGLLASRITDVSGSSDYFVGGVVCYAESEKVRFLGLDPAYIAQHGHVSAEVTLALAEAIARVTGTDWGIGITGFAGRGPNTPEDEVGHVFVAISGPGVDEVLAFRFGQHPRDRVKFFATQRALAILYGHLC